MTIEELQGKLADLKVAIQAEAKRLQAEQDEADEVHDEWENLGLGGEEPDMIFNEAAIEACNTAADLVDQAIESLDGAMED